MCEAIPNQLLGLIVAVLNKTEYSVLSPILLAFWVELC